MYLATYRHPSFFPIVIDIANLVRSSLSGRRPVNKHICEVALDGLSDCAILQRQRFITFPLVLNTQHDSRVGKVKCINRQDDHTAIENVCLKGVLSSSG
jgi:hypothetical protein